MRILSPGREPVHFRDTLGSMTAGGVLEKAGIPITGLQISVDGRRGDAATPVGPESTVALQPRAFNG